MDKKEFEKIIKEHERILDLFEVRPTPVLRVQIRKFMQNLGAAFAKNNESVVAAKRGSSTEKELRDQNKVISRLLAVWEDNLKTL